MSDERSDRHPTDEPDGTTAMAASMRPPGENVSAADPGSTDVGDDFDTSDDTDDDGSGTTERAGYDPEAVSGDTDAYRPQ